jgi:hypothetical protein
MVFRDDSGDAQIESRRRLVSRKVRVAQSDRGPETVPTGLANSAVSTSVDPTELGDRIYIRQDLVREFGSSAMSTPRALAERSTPSHEPHGSGTMRQARRGRAGTSPDSTRRGDNRPSGRFGPR